MFVPIHSFFVEWTALDLIRDENGDVVGVTVMEMEQAMFIFSMPKQCCLLPEVQVVFMLLLPMPL